MSQWPVVTVVSQSQGREREIVFVLVNFKTKPSVCGFVSPQSNSLLIPESLRNSDKRRNGPEFSSDTKKRKVEDKDSSHYVSEGCTRTQTAM